MRTNNEQAPVALIADDDETMQIMLSEAASVAGFKTHVVATGREAVAAAIQIFPDMILLDVNMPELDGFSACESIRAIPELSTTPIVMVTGNDDTDSVNNAYQCGATDFISKPMNWSLLPHRLKYIMRGADTLRISQAREQRIHRLAYYDDLTGLPNRELLRETTTTMLDNASIEKSKVALLHLDMNGFRRVNDSFGPSVGDRMLRAISRRLSAVLEQVTAAHNCSSLLSRIGGDEFVAVIAGKSAIRATGALAEMWTLCMQEPFVRDGSEIYMSTSVGIAVSPDQGKSFEDLLKNADTAMQASKKEAPGTVTEYCDSMLNESLERIQLESALRQALRENQLEMHYQPKFSVDTGAIAGVEALIRWNNDDRGWISPAMFISLAEESALILDIDRWVVNTVCRQVKEWIKVGISVPVAINISAAEFRYGDVVELIASACEEHKVDPKFIEVEITESILIRDVDQTRAVLSKLKKLGVRISVDDFGTGYSSLAYLKRFEIDTLKIDRSFVRELETSSEDKAICSAVLALARSLSLDVVAEGVETFAQHSWLASEKCTYVQGFLWSKPLPNSALTGLLMESLAGVGHSSVDSPLTLATV